MHGGHPLAAVAACIVERELRDARGGFERDDLKALDDTGHHFVLESRIQILGILADDDEVHAVVARGDRRNVPNRPQVGEELQRLAQADVHAREPAANRGRQRTFERHLVPDDRVEQFGRQRRAVLLDGGGTGKVRLPFDVEPRGFEHVDDGIRDLRADPVARNQRDAVLSHRL